MTELSDKKRGLAGWSTRDLLVTAVIGIIFGLITIPVQWAFTSLEMLASPIGSRILAGILFTPALMAAYIIRRPGAATIANLIAAIVQVPFNPFGWAVVAMGMMVSLPIDLAFAITRYKKYTLSMMMITGALAMIPGFLMHAVTAGYLNLSPAIVIGALVMGMISAALLGGWLAKALADAIAKTGVLNSFAIGKEMVKEV